MSFREEILNRKSWYLLKMLVLRELKVKYRGSILGYLWSMLNPLLFMIILSMVFSRLMRGIEHYDLYVLSGILFWNMTSHALLGGASGLVNNASLIRKVKTPTWIFALVPLGSALVNFGLAMVPYLAFLLFKGLDVPWTIAFLPLGLFVYAIFLAGLTLIMATLTVFFRDIAHMLEPIVQLLFYATPIIYDRKNPMIPEKIQTIIGYSPFTQFVEMIRGMIFKVDYMPLSLAIVGVSLALCSLLLGSFVFYKKRYELAFKI